MDDITPNDAPTDVVALLTQALELLDQRTEYVAAALVAQAISLLYCA